MLDHLDAVKRKPSSSMEDMSMDIGSLEDQDIDVLLLLEVTSIPTSQVN